MCNFGPIFKEVVTPSKGTGKLNHNLGNQNSQKYSKIENIKSLKTI